MLFLFNDVVFDLGDARSFALESPLAGEYGQHALLTLRVGRVVKMVREAVFDEPQLARTCPDKAAFLSALLAWKTDEANALLAVAARHISTPAQVQVRLASVSLVTISQLRELQEGGKLSSHAVNLSVWSHAPQRLRA
ncbi:hypothetical protein F1654_11660 [Alkalicaulis satelles]|uniref:Uncharacterized protein n=1 Tax=Alkalicaulis satelles TaxID=2609175 RepID=A0A5M6ZBM5_9PROT|nr:hypothetical protein [Alkalicaulis satelles]KAA5801550.1 hypothetical protein F1654_11660 [Alkalicaulis satelles]